ncbi:hypothetical protein [Caproiciproducens faecalis]|uniref:Transposase n=1 Tax=Caproiciproducens faecalis TaxID=2820301 RepID=A0ABS7DN03_9FIRM|nr:hypothetical protein [Caproiciproducens faecalis]MBW7572481.1 hypothetical protein [Caproiciproducens faecalis]
MSRKGIANKISKYDTDIIPRLSDIKEWIAEGDSVRDICHKLSISPDSWYRYCKDHETLSELVNMGKCLLNQDVEKSLFKLCMGYEFEELKTIVEEDRNGKKHTKLEKTKRHQPPSAQAISFFLRNRCPEEWSDKKQLVLDTAQNEQARKELFLQMLSDEQPPEIAETSEDDENLECD